MASTSSRSGFDGRASIKRDRAAAISWLVSLPEGELNSSAIAATFCYWPARGVESEGEWLVAETPEEELDRAVQVVIRRESERSRPVAIDWANRIKSEECRIRVLPGGGEPWLRRKPEAAEASSKR